MLQLCYLPFLLQYLLKVWAKFVLSIDPFECTLFIILLYHYNYHLLSNLSRGLLGSEGMGKKSSNTKKLIL